MKKLTTVAIPFVLAMLVAACGGGGGGGSPAPGNAPASNPAPETEPAPAANEQPPTGILQAGAFSPFGPSTVASNVDTANDKGLTSAARLTGSGSVVAWVAESTVRLQRLDAQGRAAGGAQSVGAVLLGDADVSTRVSVAATADGGALVAWIAPDRTVLFRRYDAAAAPIAAATRVDAAAFTKVLGIQARGLADGGFVVAWVAAEGAGPARAFLRRFDVAGAAVTDRLGVSDAVGAQTAVQVTPMPNGQFLAAWVQGNPDGTESLLARGLDAALHGAGPEQVLQGPGLQAEPRIHRYSLLGAASLSQGAALFAWASYDARSLQVRWQLLDAAGTPTIPSTRTAQVDIPLNRFMDSVEVIPGAAGFRIVAESNFSNYRLIEGYTTLVEVDGAGELLRSTESTRTLWNIGATTGAGCSAPGQPGVAASGGEDGHYLLAYATCTPKGPAPEPWPPGQLEVVGR